MSLRSLALAPILMIIHAGCTDFRFADDLRCGVNRTCPPGYFCDDTSEVCLRDLAGCGEGTLDLEEICDDGNRDSGDGCRADCLKAEVCGDGVKDPQEQCDEGDANADTAACLSTCVTATCGDGRVHAGIEGCDDGNSIDTDSCIDGCRAPTCGDGLVRFGSELCDDGNAVDGDNCNNDCRTSDIVQVAAGQSHTCVLRAPGRVRCWGDGSDGQLGYANRDDIGDDETPASAGDVPVGGLVAQIASGAFHTCALLTNGAVRCWGHGAYGQLGYGNINNIGDTETPASTGDVFVGDKVVQLAAGGLHTCALLASGAVRCWGIGNDGRLGYGNVDNIGDDEHPATAGDVSIGGAVVQIAAGDDHTCALLASGSVRCWGEGVFLGYGNTNNIGDNEAPVSAGDLSIRGTVTQLAVGSSHTCILLATGTVRCWGDESYGKLGRAHGTRTAADAADIPIGGAVARIVAGNNHTCALLTTGAVRCWGRGSALGYGNITDIGDDETPASAGDAFIGGSVVQLAAGDAHTCALLTNGTIRCWGDGYSGQLGYKNRNNIGDDELPASAGNVSVGGVVTQISIGIRHTCALLDTGRARCWGSGSQGQLGYGNINSIGDDDLPSSAGNVPVGGAVVQIATGHSHSCALLDTGNIRCWGSSNMLGYGEGRNIGGDEIPASAGDVSVGGPVTQLTLGYSHSCALLDTGKVRCWGEQAHGVLGYGNTDDVFVPADGGDVPVGGTVVQIAAGGWHTCALLDNGKVRCWGRGSAGELGYSNTNNIGDDETPASAGDVSIGGFVTQIAAGIYHTCALLDNGNVRCWGDGMSGRLGHGNISNIGDNETPASAGNVPVGGFVTQIGAGGGHTCARLNDGNVRCWGNGMSGQLGFGNTSDIGDDETPASAGNVLVGGPVAHIAVGGSATCATFVRGNVRCWGFGGDGALGYGNINNIGDNETPAEAGDVPLF